MTRARKELEEWMPSQDVIIEVLDSRMPRASSNPIVSDLRGDKPCIYVLSRTDLSDPKVTAEWLRYLGALKNTVVVQQSNARRFEAKEKIPEIAKRLAPTRVGPTKPLRAMIVGIPNVGKSTLINALMNRTVAKVGDVPAVTKARQLVQLPSGIALWDSPGILWPKIEDPQMALRLAFCGSIPDSAIDYETVAMYGAKFLLKFYPALLVARYKLKVVPETPDVLLYEIGKRRGGLRSGGKVDMHKASDALIHDFRDGALGRISLETPRRSSREVDGDGNNDGDNDGDSDSDSGRDSLDE
jgi:ribosome biogenesis GTPase A